MTKYKGQLKAPRIAQVPNFLREEAFRCDVDLSLTVNKGWWFETCLFSVEGEEDRVNRFIRRLKLAVSEYQNR